MPEATPAAVAPAQADRVVRARTNPVAEIKLRRSGGRLSLTLKSELLAAFIKGVLNDRVAAGTLSRSQADRLHTLEGGSWTGLPVYSNLALTTLREACGVASYTDQAGLFTSISPGQSLDWAIRRGDNGQEVSIAPFISPRIETGEPIEMTGMFTTKQMQTMVKAWRMFIENIHRQHAQALVVGATVTVEEFILPPEVEKMKEAARAS